MKISLKYVHLLFIAFFIFSFQSFIAAQDDPPKSRNIVPVFDEVRPPVKIAVSSGPKIERPARPVYHRIAQQTNSGRVSKANRPAKSRINAHRLPDLAENKAQQIGVTLWQLTPAAPQSLYESLQIKPNNSAQSIYESLQLNQNGKTRYLTPERRSLDTIFQTGDYVRLSVEATKRGYLYIVDQELYSDGTSGDAYLIFPSGRIRTGANLAVPGKPVEIPDLKGNPFYFELRAAGDQSKEITAEILTLIITDQPIPGIRISDFPLLLTEAKLNDWRKKWAGRAEIFETDIAGGYTKAERESASGAGSLSNTDPLPQTVFLLEKNLNAGSMITVPIWYGNND